DRRRVAVQEENRNRIPELQVAPESAGTDDHLDARILHNTANPRRREFRIDRHVGSASFEDTENGGIKFAGLFRADGDCASRSNSMSAQPIGNTICEDLELFVAEDASIALNRRLTRPNCRLPFKIFMQ